MVGQGVDGYAEGEPIGGGVRTDVLGCGKAIGGGDNVWIGGDTVVNPGVTIVENSVIVSGSVVREDIQVNVVAAGNPCRVIRQITDEDKKYYFKDREFDPEAWEFISSLK